ncbi:hypothetical protein FKP32DRAFT_1663095 [Trametes sanguinea]|nr:hypothetical protein FKP32DRAFT_1663095 [Trametes sanguinea]
MMKSARKHGVRLAVQQPSRALRDLLPIWYHVGLQPGRYVANSVTGRCLRDNHAVRTVAHCVTVARRVQYPDPTHVGSAVCPCTACHRDRAAGCANPHQCAVSALRSLHKLHPKWRTWNDSPRDGLSLTKRRHEANSLARAEHGRVLFDPSLTQGTPLACAFRSSECSALRGKVERV